MHINLNPIALRTSKTLIIRVLAVLSAIVLRKVKIYVHNISRQTYMKPAFSERCWVMGLRDAGLWGLEMLGYGA